MIMVTIRNKTNLAYNKIAVGHETDQDSPEPTLVFPNKDAFTVLQ